MWITLGGSGTRVTAMLILRVIHSTTQTPNYFLTSQVIQLGLETSNEKKYYGSLTSFTDFICFSLHFGVRLASLAQVGVT